MPFVASNTFSITTTDVPAGGSFPAPSWVTSLSSRVWSQVSSVNSINDINPRNDGALNPNGAGNRPPWEENEGIGGVMDDYTGGDVCPNISTHGVLCVWGGGHHGYHGTSVYELDLGDLTWRRRGTPYTGDYNIAGGWFPAFSEQVNGAPGPMHTYQGNIFYDPERKCLITLRAQANTSGPSFTPIAGFFPLAGSSFPNYVWQKGITDSSLKSAPSTGACGAYDTSRKIWYCQGGNANNTMNTFDPSTGSSQGNYGTWTQYRNMYQTINQVMGYNPDYDCVLMYEGREYQGLRGFSCSDIMAGPTVLTQSSTVSISQSGGMRWSPTLHGFILWSGGRDVWLLKKDASSNSWNTSTWIWQNITTRGDVNLPSANTAGTFNRFALIKYDNAEVCFTIDKTSRTYIDVFRIA